MWLHNLVDITDHVESTQNSKQLKWKKEKKCYFQHENHLFVTLYSKRPLSNKWHFFSSDSNRPFQSCPLTRLYFKASLRANLFMWITCTKITGQVKIIFIGMVSCRLVLNSDSRQKTANKWPLSISLVFVHSWESGHYFKQVILPLPPPRLCAVMEQERTPTYLNNSKTKREATNDVKIVVNPVRQTFNTTCGVYQRWSFCFLKHKQGLDYLKWDDKKTKSLTIPERNSIRLKFQASWASGCNLKWLTKA